MNYQKEHNFFSAISKLFFITLFFLASSIGHKEPAAALLPSIDPWTHSISQTLWRMDNYSNSFPVYYFCIEFSHTGSPAMYIRYALKDISGNIITNGYRDGVESASTVTWCNEGSPLNWRTSYRLYVWNASSVISRYSEGNTVTGFDTEWSQPDPTTTTGVTTTTTTTTTTPRVTTTTPRVTTTTPRVATTTPRVTTTTPRVTTTTTTSTTTPVSTTLHLFCKKGKAVTYAKKNGSCPIGYSQLQKATETTKLQFICVKQNKWEKLSQAKKCRAGFTKLKVTE